jgi:hypothetical protein
MPSLMRALPVDLRWAYCVAVLAIMIGVFPCRLASAQSITASLSGVIFDEQHAVLPGATVTLRSRETGQIRTAVSSQAGTYRVVGVPPGRYELSAELTGFATDVRSDVTLSVSEEAQLDLTLTLATLAEAVTVVSADLALVEPSKSSLGQTITSRQIDDLPIVGRSFGDFTRLATLTPGIVPDVAPGFSGIATAGQTGRNNTILIDGLSDDEAIASSVRGSFPIDAIREFVVVSNQFGAEYGQASGAVVNVLTKSGTNQYTGRGFYFQHDNTLDATPGAALLATPRPKTPTLSQRVFGGIFGGPIVPNRAFFFVSLEDAVQDSEYIVTSPRLGDFRPTDPNHVPIHNQNPKGFGRVDVSPAPSNILTARYRIDVNRGALIPEPLSVLERVGEFTTRDADLAVLNNHAWGSSVLHEFRGQFATHVFETVDPRCPDCVSETRASILLGKPPNVPQRRTEDHWQLVDVLTYLLPDRLGDHALKGGVEATLVQAHSFFPNNFSGTFRFRDKPFDPNDPTSYPVQYTRNEGNANTVLRDNDYGLFWQDQWKPRPNLTLNLGVRWDHEETDGPSSPQNSLAPRLGIAFDPWKTGKTSIRAGFGRYYDRLPLNVDRDATAGLVTTMISNPDYPNPFNSNQGRVGVVALPSTTRFASDQHVPFTSQVSVGVQHALLADVALTADAVWAHGHNLLTSLDVNYPDLNGTRPDQTFQQIVVKDTRGHSRYTGLQVGLHSRHVRGYSYTLAYTWSKAEADTDGGFAQDQRDQSAEWGPIENDARHRLSANVNVDLPRGLHLATLIVARSALPYNVTTGAPNVDGYLIVRPAGMGRNAARGADFWQVDLRVSKTIAAFGRRLDLLAEAFNVVNRRNWTGFVGNKMSSSFSKPTDAAIPREVQLGVRLTF